MDLEAMDQTDCDEKLSSALSTIRTVPNCTTGESPHFLVFGSEARTIADVVYPTDNSKDDQTKRQDAFSKTLDRLTAIHGKVRKRMMDENAKRLKRQNKNTRFTPFEEGEKVWVYGPPARKGLSKKLLAERWRGPYVVTKKLGETLYKVSLEKGKRHTKIVNHRRLKRHYERPNHLAALSCEESEVEGTCTASSEESEGEAMIDISTEKESTEDEQQMAAVAPRPRRNRNPPLRLTYGLRGEQMEVQDFADDSD